MQTGQIFKMAIIYDHDTDSGNNDDDEEEEGSARETRRFQSSEFQERDRDIRAEEQTLFTLKRSKTLKERRTKCFSAFHFAAFQCFKNAQLFTLWCFGAFEISLGHQFANKLHEIFDKSREVDSLFFVSPPMHKTAKM